MRFSCIQISFGDEYPDDRYTDLTTGNNTIADEGASALTDDYYGWIQGDGFQWYIQPSMYEGVADDIVVAFYESHPLFNCFMFYEAFDEVERGQRSAETLFIAEDFMLSVYKKWRRSRSRKKKKE